MGDQLFGAATAAFLMQFGQLARHRDFATGQGPGNRGEAFCQARRGLEKDQRRTDRAEFGEYIGTRLFLRGQEPGKQETVAGQTRHGQRRHRRAGTGNDGDGHTCRARLAHQTIAGVRHQRHARIADQCHRLARHAAEQLGALTIVSVVIVAQ